MFRTQYNRNGRRPKGETNTGITQVTQVVVKSNTERIAQMLIAGQYMAAQRMGYQWTADDKIPEDARPLPGKNADVTAMLTWIQDFGGRLREFRDRHNAEMKRKTAEENKKEEVVKQE